MLVLLTALLATVIPGLIAWQVALRWRRAHSLAPTIEDSTIRKQVRTHRRAFSFLLGRSDVVPTTGVLLIASAIVIIAGAVGIGVMLIMIHTNSGLARLDHTFTLFGAHHASHLSTSVLRIYTQVGGALVIVPLAVIVAAVESWRQRTYAVVIFLALTVGGQFAIANLTKSLVNRARPSISQLTGFSGSSFPSGHAVACAAGLTAMALVLGRGRSNQFKAAIVGIAVGLSTGVAATRVLLGVHWLTDVLGGLLLGWAWYALCSITFGGRRLKFGAPVIMVEQTPAPLNVDP